MTIQHPNHTVIATHLEHVAKLMRADGEQARLRAVVLAARGYPAATLGSGSRSSDSTTSVERAVGLTGDYGPATPPDHAWHDVDSELANLTRLLWATSSRYENLVARVLAQAGDDDPVPAGTGSCLRCEKLCRPTGKRPGNRIRAGFCNACYLKWIRLGKPDRFAFIRSREEQVA